MTRIRVIGPVLVAIFAIGAIASASAFAEPTFSTTAKFTGKQIGTGNLETPSGLEKVECKTGESPGEIVNSTQTKKVVVKFEKCKSLLGSCKTAGASAEEIRTSTLKGELGLVGTNEAAEALEPESGTVEATFECGGLGITVKGGVACAIGPTGKAQTTSKLACEGSGGAQKFTSFNGSSTKTTRTVELITEKGGKTTKSDESATAEITASVAVEIT
jgi:hypothetical protein